MRKSIAFVVFVCLFLTGLSSRMSTAREQKTGDDPKAAARAFIAEHEKVVRPLEREASLAWWNANVSGRDQDFEAKEQCPEQARRGARGP